MPGQTVVYRVVDSVEIKADLYFPEAPPPYPCILFLHGGALIWGSRQSLIPEQVTMFLDVGYAFFAVDYRLAPETKLEAIVSDVEMALAWLSGSDGVGYGIDPARIAVLGSSAGGYLALHCGTLPRPPAAVVSFYGYGDILAEWYATPSQHYLKLPPVSAEEAAAAVGRIPLTEGDRARFSYYLHCRQHGIWTRAVSGLDSLARADRQRLERLCPALNVGGAFPPTFVVHGDADTDVPVAQSEQMAAALRSAGVHHELMIVPGAGHAFDRDMDRPEVQAMIRAVLCFLGEVL